MTPCREPPKRQRGRKRLAVVVYKDHVLFRDLPPKAVKPIIRVCVGWIVYEDQDHILIVSDKPAGGNGSRFLDETSSGLLLLKNAVIEVRELG